MDLSSSSSSSAAAAPSTTKDFRRRKRRRQTQQQPEAEQLDDTVAPQKPPKGLKRAREIEDYEHKNTQTEETPEARVRHLLQTEAELDPNHPINRDLAGPPPANLAELHEVFDSTRGLAFDSDSYWNKTAAHVANVSSHTQTLTKFLTPFLVRCESALLAEHGFGSCWPADQSTLPVQLLVFQYCREALVVAGNSLGTSLLRGFRELSFFARRQHLAGAWSALSTVLLHLHKLSELELESSLPDLQQLHQQLVKDGQKLFYDLLPLLLALVKEERCALQEMIKRQPPASPASGDPVSDEPDDQPVAEGDDDCSDDSG